MVEITNILTSGDLGVEIDVGVVETDLLVPYTEYDPDNYHGLYVRLAKDGPLITLYRSGKYTITGGSSFEEVDETNRGFLKSLIELDVIDSAVETGFTVQNVVCTGELHRSVNLNALSIGLGFESVEYEPEQFSGLIYRPTDYPAMLLVFANGSVVITGAADVETADEAFNYIQTQVNDLLGD